MATHSTSYNDSTCYWEKCSVQECMLTYYILTGLYYLVRMALFPVIKRGFGGIHHIQW